MLVPAKVSRCVIHQGKPCSCQPRLNSTDLLKYVFVDLLIDNFN